MLDTFPFKLMVQHSFITAKDQENSKDRLVFSNLKFERKV